MEYFSLGGSSIIKKNKSGKSQKVSENVLNKAMQNGGGMMFNPKSGKVLMWPGMWSPSDIGKPDCGTPVVSRVLEPGEPIRTAVKDIIKPQPKKSDLRKQIETRQKEINPKLEQLRQEVAGVSKENVDPKLLQLAKDSLAKYEKTVAQLGRVQKESELDQLAQQLAQQSTETMAFVSQIKPQLIPLKPKVIEAPIPVVKRKTCEEILGSKGYKRSGTIKKGEDVVEISVCKESDCDYMLKIIPYIPGGGFEREVEIYNRLSRNNNLVVKMIDHWNCDMDSSMKKELTDLGFSPSKQTKVGYIIQEKMDESFATKKPIPQMVIKMINQLDELHKLGIVHYKPTLDNIMFKSPNKILFKDLDMAWYFGDNADKRVNLNMQAVDYFILMKALENAGLYTIEVDNAFNKRLIDLYKQGWDYKDTDTDYRGDSQYWNRDDIKYGAYADSKLGQIEFVKISSDLMDRGRTLKDQVLNLRIIGKHVKNRQIRRKLEELTTLERLVKIEYGKKLATRADVHNLNREVTKLYDKADKLVNEINKILQKKGNPQDKPEVKEAIDKDVFFGVQTLPSDYRDRCQQILVEKEYKEGKQIAAGIYGKVSEACLGYEDCLKNDYKYVIKMQPFRSKDDIYEDGYKKEVNINEVLNKRSSQSDFYVKFLDSWDCDLTPAAVRQLQQMGIKVKKDMDKLGITIMEKWDGTLRNLFNNKTLLKSDIVKIIKVIDKFHEAGLFHHDAHMGNFLYRGNGKDRQWAIADFGQAWNFGDDEIIGDKWKIIDGTQLTKSNLGTNLAFDYYRTDIGLRDFYKSLYADPEIREMFKERYHDIRRKYNWDVTIDEKDFYGFSGYDDLLDLFKHAHELAFTPEDEKRKTEILQDLRPKYLIIKNKLEDLQQNHDSRIRSNPKLLEKVGELEDAYTILHEEIDTIENTFSPRVYERAYKYSNQWIDDQLIADIDEMINRDDKVWTKEVNGVRQGLESSISRISIDITALKNKVSGNPDLLSKIQDINTDQLEPLSTELSTMTSDTILTKEQLKTVSDETNSILASVRDALVSIEKEIPEEGPPTSRERRESLTNATNIQEKYKNDMDELKRKREEINSWFHLPDPIDKQITLLNKQIPELIEIYNALIEETNMSGLASLTKSFEEKYKKINELVKNITKEVEEHTNKVYQLRTQKQLDALDKLQKFVDSRKISTKKSSDFKNDIDVIIKQVKDTVKEPYPTVIKALNDNDIQILRLQELKKAKFRKIQINVPENTVKAKQEAVNSVEESFSELSTFKKAEEEYNKRVTEFDEWRKGKFVNFVKANQLVEDTTEELDKIDPGLSLIRNMIDEWEKTPFDFNPTYKTKEVSKTDLFKVHGKTEEFVYIDLNGILYKLEFEMNNRGKNIITKSLKNNTHESSEFVGQELVFVDFPQPGIKSPKKYIELTYTDTESDMVLNNKTIMETIDETYEEFMEIMKKVIGYVEDMDIMKDEYERRESKLQSKFDVEQSALAKEVKDSSLRVKQVIGTLRSGRTIKSNIVNVETEEVIDNLRINAFEPLWQEYLGMNQLLKNMLTFQPSGIIAKLRAPIELPSNFNKLQQNINKSISTLTKNQVKILEEGANKTKLLSEYKNNLMNLTLGLAELRVYKGITPEKLKSKKELQSLDIPKKITEAKQEAKRLMNEKFIAAGAFAAETVKRIQASKRPELSPGTFVAPSVKEDLMIARKMVDKNQPKVSLPNIKVDRNIGDILNRSNIGLQAFEGMLWFISLSKLFNLRIIENDGQSVCDSDCIIERTLDSNLTKPGLTKQDAKQLNKFILSIVNGVSPVKLSSRNPEMYIRLVDESLEKINNLLLKTKLTELTRTRLTKMKQLLEEEKIEATKIKNVPPRRESEVQLHTVEFPQVRSQKDIPNFIKFLDIQLNQLKQLKKDNMEKKSVPGDIQTKIRNIVEKRILPSISTNNPGLFQKGILYIPGTEGTIFTRDKPSKNYLLEIEKNLVNVYPLTIWLFDKEEANYNKSKIVSALTKLRLSNPQAAKEIKDSNEYFLTRLKLYINKTIDKPEDLIEEDDKTIETILTQLGRLRTIINGMPYSNERDNASSTVNTYFTSLRKQNLKKIDNILEGMLVDTSEDGS